MSAGRRAIAFIVALSGAAFAGPPVRVSANATATVETRLGGLAAINAIDGSSSTAWCATNANGGAGASLTLRFDRPIAIASIDILTGAAAPEGKRSVVDALSISLPDGRTIPIERTDARFAHDIGGHAVRSLTVTIARVHGDDGGYACVRDVSIGYPLYTGSKRALDALRPTLVAVRAAFTTCDAKRFALLVRFPFERVEGASALSPHDRDVVSITSPSQLAAECVDSKDVWNIGGTLDSDLSSIRFLNERSALVSWDAKWWLDWDGAHWWLTSVD